MNNIKLSADFNGLFGDLLCLSHSDMCKDEHGTDVKLVAGMQVTAFDLDADENGAPDNLLASGIVEPSPDWLQCRRSRWALRIDQNGVRHKSDIQGVQARRAD